MTEMLALKKTGADLIILPRDGRRRMRHAKGNALRDNALPYPPIDIKIAFAVLKFAMARPKIFFDLIDEIAVDSGSLRIALKNLAVLPKAIFLAGVIKNERVSHIHAHWASTTSTIAYIVSRITSIPWSFTAHRWDITENNMLKTKCLNASFARIINERAREEIAGITGDLSLAGKPLNIHMGVEIPETCGKTNGCVRTFTLLCPANLYHVKGHKYLLEACAILSRRGVDFKCIVAGIGPLEKALKKTRDLKGLWDKVDFKGLIPHESLMAMYASGEVSAVVLPSVAYKNEKEGSPVALMEAMAHGIPVVSTNTGGIPELIGDGSGIMVTEKDPTALADAIEGLIRDQIHYRTVGKKGRAKIMRDYDLEKVSARLAELFDFYG